MFAEFNLGSRTQNQPTPLHKGFLRSAKPKTTQLANELSAPAQAAPTAGRPNPATSSAVTQAATNTATRPALGPLLEQVRAQPRIALIVGGAVLAAGIAAIALWGHSPEYKVLYANVSDRDGGAIIASLQQMNVPYKFTEGGGAILVAADKVSEARLKLAAQGLPKSGAVGFELLDNQKFGTSQFAEQVNYQRGLEGELARSIESIGSVETARVHLALPKASLFVRDQKKPSASVVLKLHRGRSVDEGQVNAIVHLVSSSIPDLDAKSVTVVDQRGNLLSAANGGTRGLDSSQLKYVENVEQSYVRRIEAIVQPIVGAGNVRAQVAADVDFNVVERTDEQYRPNQEPGAVAIRSQQSSESNQVAGTVPGGVPGALSNQPPIAPTAPLGAASGAAKAASESVATTRASLGNSRRDVTTNYEVDRTISHTQQSAGATKRLSVAVVVNHREVRAPDGKASLVALTAAEMEQIRSLVKEAMGFNQARGDSLNVVNSAFSVDTYTTPELPYWKDPQNLELAKTVAPYLLIALALLVASVVIARAMRRGQAQQKPAEPAALPAGEEMADLAPLQLAESPRDTAQERENDRRKADIEYAKELASQDPRLVASLIRHWMTA